VQLLWTGNGNPEYAIYADTNPFDGVLPDTFIAATSGESINIDTTNYAAFSTTGAYVFTVRARSVAGDSGSESIDSQYAFVEMEDFDGGADPSGGWQLFYMNSTVQLTVVPGPIDGNALYMAPCDNYQWDAALSPQLPVISDTEYSVFEIAQRTVDIPHDPWELCLAAMYANTTIGWTTKLPANGDPTYTDFRTLPLDCAIDGTWPIEDQLNPDCSLVAVSEYFGPDESMAFWHGWRIRYLDYAGDPPPVRFTRAWVPEYRSETGVRAAFGFADYNTYPDSTGLPYPCWVDEFAVIIY